jgi:AcrR family transcriptional regulator
VTGNQTRTPHQRAGRARTRAQAQAHTRELVLRAAEKLFLAKGLHATTVAEIAAAAGRTQGSIYGNFDSKEALCLAALERRYQRMFAELEARLADCGGFADKLATVAQWWRANSSDDALTLLVAEFAVAARRDPERRPMVTAAFTLVRNAFGSIFAEHFEPTNPNGNGLVDVATLGVLSTGIGLAVGQAVSMSDADMSTNVLSETLSLWVERLETP